MTHATIYSYRKGCRCDPCVDRYRQSIEKYRARTNARAIKQIEQSLERNECISDGCHNARINATYCKIHRDRHNAWQRTDYQRRRMMGMCINRGCLNDAEEARTRCSYHAAKAIQYHKGQTT